MSYAKFTYGNFQVPLNTGKTARDVRNAFEDFTSHQSKENYQKLAVCFKPDESNSTRLVMILGVVTNFPRSRENPHIITSIIVEAVQAKAEPYVIYTIY